MSDKTFVYRITAKYRNSRSSKEITSLVKYTEDIDEVLRAVIDHHLIEVMQDSRGFLPITVRINDQEIETRTEYTEEEFEDIKDESDNPKSIFL